MVRISKIYTRTGDQGQTRLAGGQSVSKTSQRIEAYGTIDELNSALGLVGEALREQKKLAELRNKILRIQNELFNLGAQLAVLAGDRRENTPVIHSSHIDQLESEIDFFTSRVPSLKSFILPGGGEIAARLHLARTICRRAEREVIRLGETEPLDGTEIPYLNRLSDWLFAAARFVTRTLNIPENLWKP